MPPRCVSLATLVPLALLIAGPARAADTPARTRIGAFVTSLSDIQESTRRFDVTLWVWLLSPADVGEFDPVSTYVSSRASNPRS